MEQKQTQPLSTVRSGESVRLASIEAGRGLNSRLASMGLVPHTIITVVNNGHPGPFVINVKGTRMMLGRGMAHKIMVCSCDHEKNHSRLSGQS
jgi:Fe2+ transport system protein FeoA